MNHKLFLTSDSNYFPDLNDIDDTLDGLYAIGGDLSPKRLINAYKIGAFPYYDNDNMPILWYHPKQRMVITKDHLKITKSMQKFINKSNYTIKCNTQFKQVIQHCRLIKRKQNGTWITHNMQQAYIQLHQQGIAHSYEVFDQENLIAGLYGISLGQVFFGESMFTTVNNASKLALIHLVNKTQYQLIDCQLENPHLKSLGAYCITRQAFVKKIKQLI